MSDEQALIRAVCADPADDLARLAYADWLEENAGTVACRECGGTGWEPGRAGFERCNECLGCDPSPDGRLEHSEFIRVQLELARLEAAGWRAEAISRRSADLAEYGGRLHDLRRRERWLFSRLVMRFHALAPWGTRCVLTLDEDTASSLPVLLYRRGFAERVRLSLAEWLAKGPELVLRQPVVAAVDLDRDPAVREYGGGCETACWHYAAGSWDEYARHGRCYVPLCLFDLMAGREHPPEEPGRVEYSDTESARAGLSGACVAWARTRANLPTLTGREVP